MNLASAVLVLQLALQLLVGSQTGTEAQKQQAIVFANQAVSLVSQSLQLGASKPAPATEPTPQVVIPNVVDASNPAQNPPSCEISVSVDKTFPDQLNYSYKLQGAIDPKTIGDVWSVDSYKVGEYQMQRLHFTLTPDKNPGIIDLDYLVPHGVYNASFGTTVCSAVAE